MIDLSQGAHGTVFSAEGGVVDSVDRDGSIYRTQDVTAILEANKREQNNAQKCGFGKAPVFRRVASIPRAVFDLARAQGIDLFNDPDAMRRFLNNPDNRLFRTTLEKV